MADKNTVNYEFALEMQGMRADQTNRRLFIIVILLIVALLGSNAGWLYYESQYVEEKVVIDAEQQADGDSQNYIIGGDFDAGQTKSNDN